MHMVRDDPAESTPALSAELDDRDPPRPAGHLMPLRSHAYRRAMALLSVYRSRVDFPRHREIDGDSEKLPYRFKNGPPPPRGRDPAAIR